MGFSYPPFQPRCWVVASFCIEFGNLGISKGEGTSFVYEITAQHLGWNNGQEKPKSHYCYHRRFFPTSIMNLDSSALSVPGNHTIA